MFASPHSGALYSPDFIAATRLDPITLRRSEDSFVDELFADAPAHGAPLLSATFPRAQDGREVVASKPAVETAAVPINRLLDFLFITDSPELVSQNSLSAYKNGLFTASDFPAPAPGTEGKIPRNCYRNPGMVNVDASLAKNTHLPWVRRIRQSAIALRFPQPLQPCQPRAGRRKYG